MKVWNGIVGLVLVAGLASGAIAGAQQQPLSVRAANAAMEKWPGGLTSGAGTPEPSEGQGILLEGIQAVWRNTVDRRDFAYIKRSIDALITPNGFLPPLKPGQTGLSDIQLGRPVLLLYEVTLDKRYYRLASALYLQPEQVPTNASGESWEAQGDPFENLEESVPFHAEYALKFHRSEVDSQNAFAQVLKDARDPNTGLLRYGWNESREAHPASAHTGPPPSRDWARGMGWYMAGLVDSLPYVQADDPARKQLIAILNEEAAAVVRYQDAKTGLWWKVIDKAEAEGNSPEATASCLLIYALAKGVRRGYLPQRYDAVAERAYQGILSHFVTSGVDGSLALHGTLSGPLEMGAFILASTEIENVQNAKIGRGMNVMVDGWFNSQKMKDATGQEIYFHYKWEEESNPGYSLWGHAFRNFGARTTALYAEPTFENLQPAQVYIIASPDNLDKNPQAHFANATDAKEIAKWVKAGGVLAIMENDTSFADLDHFNVVAEKFGIHFNSTLRMHVVGTDWAMGGFYIDGKGPIFHSPHTAYVKDVCTISVKPPAVPVYKHEKDIFMAEAKYGKGTVYAMVDPWFYNEYTNGLKLPAKYDNYAASVELARWLLEQVPKPEGSGISGQGSGTVAVGR